LRGSSNGGLWAESSNQIRRLHGRLQRLEVSDRDDCWHLMVVSTKKEDGRHLQSVDVSEAQAAQLRPEVVEREPVPRPNWVCPG
jgi:hypothetical protein